MTGAPPETQKGTKDFTRRVVRIDSMKKRPRRRRFASEKLIGDVAWVLKSLRSSHRAFLSPCTHRSIISTIGSIATNYSVTSLLESLGMGVICSLNPNEEQRIVIHYSKVVLVEYL